jgi:4-hydroxy-tetrahydrodipicolinate synthase
MKKPIFTGTSVAIVTPFKNDGRVDFDKFKELVEFHAENGTNSITVAGTTGECSTLTDDEQIELIEKCVEYVNGRMIVIAGTGSNDTMHGIKLSKAAEKAGADALLIVTPYYNKTSQNGLVKHYMQIADSVNIPMVLYSVPGRTGMTIGIDALKKLSEHPMINGLKDANSNFEQLLATIHACGDNLNIWCGNDTEIVPMMALGAKGVISVWANIDPKAVLRVTDACMNGDYAYAAKLQANAYELLKALFIETNPIPVKTAMNLMGFEIGELRMPLCEMLPQNESILKKVLLEKGFIQ